MGDTGIFTTVPDSTRLSCSNFTAQEDRSQFICPISFPPGLACSTPHRSWGTEQQAPTASGFLLGLAIASPTAELPGRVEWRWIPVLPSNQVLHGCLSRLRVPSLECGLAEGRSDRGPEAAAGRGSPTHTDQSLLGREGPVGKAV